MKKKKERGTKKVRLRVVHAIHLAFLSFLFKWKGICKINAGVALGLQISKLC